MLMELIGIIINKHGLKLYKCKLGILLIAKRIRKTIAIRVKKGLNRKYGRTPILQI